MSDAHRDPLPEGPGEPRIDGFPPGTEDLAGLALSGGGVRSATFALGALQALRDLDILKAFDYLSTVSGGGFAGAWWSAWLSRPPWVTGGSPFPPPEKLEPDRFPAVLLSGAAGRAGGHGLGPTAAPLPSPPPTAAIDPVHHLRLFANYLTPRRGLYSADTWRGITFYLRTLLFTWLMLLPLLLAAVMAVQWLFAGDALRKVELGDATVATGFLCSAPDSASGPSLLPASTCRSVTPVSHAQVLKARLAYAAAPLVVLGVVLVTLSVLWLLHATAHSVAALLGVAGALTLIGLIVVAATGGEGSGRLVRVAGVTAALAIAAHCVLVVQGAIEERRVRHDVHRVELGRWQSWTLSTMVALAALLAVGGFGHELVWFLVAPDTGAVWQGVRRSGGWGAVLAAVASAAFAAYKTVPSGRVKDSAETYGPVTTFLLRLAPYIVLGVLLAGFSWLGWALPAFWAERDARLPAAGVLLTWASLFVLGFGLLEWVRERLPRAGAPANPWWRWSPVDNAVLSGALLVAAVLALEGSWQWWRGERLVEPGELTRACARFGGIFALGFAGGEVIRWRERWNGRALLLAALASVGLVTEAFSAADEPGHLAWQIMLLLVLWVVGLGWMVDPNLLSMHAFYRARLTRAYLGASNPDRPLAITEESAGDDVALMKLAGHALGGPYHLVNTTLNLAGARDLAAGQRPAANFIFSRYFCGSGRTAYRWTTEYMGGRLSLGTAMAISGAAAAPTMGTRTPSLALVMLMALLNVRLGSWMPNPARAHWREGQAHLWPFYLAHEFLAHATDTSTYCYLTDGGHFDNTGLYALVERGCRYVVVLDSGADPRLTCEDIGQAVRMCRIDFGAEIRLDVGQFRRRGPDRLAARHVVVGDIVYHPEHWRSLGWKAPDAAARTGRIVWVKPMVVAGDAADVRQYGRQNPEFPQQTTLDQWYDEAQFESYRKLGYESVVSAFPGVRAPQPRGRAWIGPLFMGLRTRP